MIKQMRVRTDKEKGESIIPSVILIPFLRQHPSPNDALVHRFAIQHNYEIDDVEEAIYKRAKR